MWVACDGSDANVSLSQSAVETAEGPQLTVVHSPPVHSPVHSPDHLSRSPYECGNVAGNAPIWDGLSINFPAIRGGGGVEAWRR